MAQVVNNVGKSVVVRIGDIKFNGTIQKNVFGNLEVKLEDGREIKCKVDDLVHDSPEVAPVYAEQKVPASYTDEGLQSKIVEAPAPSGVFSIADEWHGQVQRGDVFGEAAEQWQEANPDKEFRFLSDLVCKSLGTRDYQPVYDANGTKVKVGGQTLGWIPKDVYKQRRDAIEATNKANRAAVDDNAQEALAKGIRDGGGAIQSLNPGDMQGLTPYGTRKL